MKILIVEDEQHIADGLRFNLEADGYEAEIAANGEAALDMLKNSTFDAIVLDVMLPGIDGFAVAKTLREQKNFTPILMLTARSRPEDVLKGFEAGTDDYLPKPFEPRELVARMQAVLRRGSQDAVDIVRAGLVEVNFTTRSARVDGRDLSLTTAELELLGFLVRNPGRVLSRERIMEGTHGINWAAFDRSIDVLISRLRQKLGDDPRQPAFIRTVRGVGYSFVGSTNG
jgi:DNA-binding response OmpR family regulator